MNGAELAGRVWQDLQPAPGRLRDACKVTLAALIVAIFMLSTSMPLIDLGTYLVFLLAQRDSLRIRMLGLGSIFVAGLASLLVVGVMVAAWDVAWLRLVLWSLIFLAGFFLMRVFIEPDVFLGPLVIVALCTFIVDQVPLPNALLDQLGWLWAMLPVVVGAFLLADWLLGTSSPRQTLRRQVSAAFATVEESMRLRARGGRSVPLDDEEIEDAVKRASLLCKLRVLSADQAGRCVEILRLLGRLETAAQELDPRSETPQTWESLAALAAGIREKLSQGAAAPGVDGLSHSARSTALREACTRLHEAALRWNTGDPPGSEGTLESTALLLPDWAKNPAYRSFAIRATAATMTSYLLMSLTSWNGIHTCMVTCVVTALTSSRARVRKQNLRIAGAAIGAVAGVGTLIFVLPAHDTLLGLVVVLALGSFVSAWVAVGPLRIYYAGLQMALAFYYVLLADPHITTDLDPIRDRLIGIFVGILAMRIAFTGLKNTAADQRDAP